MTSRGVKPRALAAARRSSVHHASCSRMIRLAESSSSFPPHFIGVWNDTPPCGILCEEPSDLSAVGENVTCSGTCNQTYITSGRNHHHHSSRWPVTNREALCFTDSLAGNVWPLVQPRGPIAERHAVPSHDLLQQAFGHPGSQPIRPLSILGAGAPSLPWIAMTPTPIASSNRVLTKGHQRQGGHRNQCEEFRACHASGELDSRNNCAVMGSSQCPWGVRTQDFLTPVSV